MSDLTDLKKVIEGNSKAISLLIQAESNSDRIKQEIASNQRVLEGLHEKIKAAKVELESAQAETTSLRTSAQKDIGDVVRSTDMAKADAEARLAEAKRLERAAQTKLDDAEDIRKQCQSALAEVMSQKEKLKAALA